MALIIDGVVNVRPLETSIECLINFFKRPKVVDVAKEMEREKLGEVNPCCSLNEGLVIEDEWTAASITLWILGVSHGTRRQIWERGRRKLLKQVEFNSHQPFILPLLLGTCGWIHRFCFLFFVAFLFCLYILEQKSNSAFFILINTSTKKGFNLRWTVNCWRPFGEGFSFCPALFWTMLMISFRRIFGRAKDMSKGMPDEWQEGVEIAFGTGGPFRCI